MKPFALLTLILALAACTHHIVVEQAKPMEFNINISGQVEVVIKDARQNMEQITGEKPSQNVRPEDIGLAPPATAPAAKSSALFPIAGPVNESRVVYLADFSRPLAQSEDDLKKAMAARNAEIQTLWSGGVVGEAHDGLLAVRGSPNAQQKSTIAAENADRSALYAAEAKRRGIKVDEVALSYYLARLGYAKNGAWYEVYNQTAKQWEWKQWPNK